MQYQVIRSGRKTLALQVKDGRLIVRVPHKTRQADIEKFVQNNMSWIQKQLGKAEQRANEARLITPMTEEELAELSRRAADIIPRRVRYYAAIMGVDYAKVTIRCQRTRWGSCSSKGNLNFNCLLMLAPPQVLDSVVAHEMCHRKHMNHSKEFYDELLTYFPEYHKWHGWLKQNGHALFARLPSKK